MKIRQGFVSNSSTSSFIIQIRDKWKIFNGEKHTPLTKKEINLLLKHGFYYCYERDPLFLRDEITETKRLKQEDIDILDSYVQAGKKCPKNKINHPEYIGLRVVCNQDFPISFLVHHDIPFIASVHYGHHTYVYKRGWKDIIVMNNIGLQNGYGDRAEQLFSDSCNKKAKEVPGTIAWKINKKSFLRSFSEEKIESDIKGSKI